MKHFEKIAVCLAGGLALSAGLRAETVPTTGNPYSLVVARNIFGLNPPVAVDTTSPVAEPPVKITPNGIMNNYGQVQVLFKVAGKAPGKDDSYMLSEGQAEEGIEVVKIDEKDGLVTFNNHGVEQVLSLAAAATAGPSAMATPAGPAGITGGNPAAGGNYVSSGFNTAFGGRSGTGGGNNPGMDNGSNVRPVPTRYGSQLPPMDPAVQTVLIEANRMKAQNEGDPIQKIFPRTELTPPPDSGDANPAPTAQ